MTPLERELLILVAKNLAERLIWGAVGKRNEGLQLLDLVKQLEQVKPT